jgi:hypothetical protein
LLAKRALVDPAAFHDLHKVRKGAAAGQYGSATEVRLAAWLIRVCLLRASGLGSVYEAENQRIQEDRTRHSPVLLLLGRETEDTEPEEVLAHVLSSGIKTGRVTGRMSRTPMCKSGDGKAVETWVAD